MSLPVGLISDNVYAQAFSPSVWNSGSQFSPYSYGSARVETTSQEILNILLGRPEFGDTFAIHGPKRTGKTLLAVFILVERLRESLDIFGDYIDAILSNVTLDLSSIGMQDKFRQFTDIEQVKDLRNGILFLDEIRRLADSYMTQSQQSRLTSNLLADTGKQVDDFYYTDQSMNGPPSRIRVNVDYVMSPIYDPYTTWVPGGPPGIVKTYVFDSLNSFNMFFNPQFPGMPLSKPIYQFAFYAPPFFKFYKTGQKIEDYHFKFNPDIYIEQFIGWHAKTWPRAPYGKKLLKLWNTVAGKDLSTDERDSVLTTMELKGLLDNPPQEGVEN